MGKKLRQFASVPGIALDNRLFESDFYNIKTWDLGMLEQPEKKGFNDCFCFVFVKNGNYFFGQTSQRYNMRTGHIILEKGQHEYRLWPSAGDITIFNFTNDFYKRYLEERCLKNTFFFSNPNLISQVLLASPEMEYLHYQILNGTTTASKLEMDSLVLELLERITACITNEKFEGSSLDDGYILLHLSTIEKAKLYLLENFASDISLFEISRHCLVSPFHFSRLFKKTTAFSPYQFLLNIRLKHSEMLLKNTSLTVSEIGLSCGFGSPEHFSTAFRQHFNMNPNAYRKA